MRTGMLWFDNDPKTDLRTKITRAVEYYEKKYGSTPNLCFVHPSMVQETSSNTGSVEVRTSRQIMPNHLWLGLNDTRAQLS